MQQGGGRKGGRAGTLLFLSALPRLSFSPPLDTSIDFRSSALAIYSHGFLYWSHLSPSRRIICDSAPWRMLRAARGAVLLAAAPCTSSFPALRSVVDGVGTSYIRRARPVLCLGVICKEPALGVEPRSGYLRVVPHAVVRAKARPVVATSETLQAYNWIFRHRRVVCRWEVHPAPKSGFASVQRPTAHCGRSYQPRLWRNRRGMGLERQKSDWRSLFLRKSQRCRPRKF